MDNSSGGAGVLLGFLLCGGVSVLFIAIFGVVLFLIIRQVSAGSKGGGGFGSARVNKAIEAWAEDHDYEVLGIEDIPKGEDHPFKDRFGFGLGKKPAAAKRIEVADRKGRERSGWVYLPARRAGTHHFEFVPNALEVAWDD